MKEEGQGFGEGFGSDSGWIWDPITVIIPVGEMTMLALRDAAVAAWHAAGDTVVLDDVVVAAGATSRGTFRIFGLAAFLTQMDGDRTNERRISGTLTYEYPNGMATTRQIDGRYDGTSRCFCSYKPLPAANPAPPADVLCARGEVWFYCGEMVKTCFLDVNGHATCTFTGTELGGGLGSYTMTAVWSGCIVPFLPQQTIVPAGRLYAGSQATLTIGVN